MGVDIFSMGVSHPPFIDQQTPTCVYTAYHSSRIRERLYYTELLDMSDLQPKQEGSITSEALYALPRYARTDIVCYCRRSELITVPGDTLPPSHVAVLRRICGVTTVAKEWPCNEDTRVYDRGPSQGRIGRECSVIRITILPQDTEDTRGPWNSAAESTRSLEQEYLCHSSTGYTGETNGLNEYAGRGIPLLMSGHYIGPLIPQPSICRDERHKA